MKKLEILNAHVGYKNGLHGLIIPDKARQAYQDMLEYCKEKKGGYVSVILHPPRKPRTTGDKSQNHHLNGHISQIAQETGEDFSVIKDEVKMRAIKRGYPTRTSKLGRVIPISETECDTTECAMLIDTAHEIADFLEIKLQER